MKFLSTFLGIALLAPVVAAQQQPKPLAVSPDQPVANDDRGQAFILTRDLQPLSAFGHRRKTPMSDPQQLSIFAGKDWATTLHARETQLQSLLANVDNEADLAALQDNGIKDRFGPAFSVERADIGPGAVSDLDAQRLLAAMLSEGGLPRPNAGTILVIFLDANLQSTLGSLAAGKHYAAYHSAFNFDGARIRYVVVPYESDPATGYQIALRAFVAAALKPTQPIAK
jgi:hypothetical protein